MFVYHFDLVRSGTIEINQPEQLRHLVNEVVENRPCVGVGCERVDEVGYMSAELKDRSLPWRRVFSRICTRLVKINDTPVANGLECQRKCRSCHRVQVRLAEHLNHREALSPEDVKKRQSSSSKVPISYLSPNSRSKRLKNVRESRKTFVHNGAKIQKEMLGSTARFTQCGIGNAGDKGVQHPQRKGGI